MWKDGVYVPLPRCPDQAVVWIEQTVACPMLEQASRSADAIHLAAQVGRLDVVSLILGMFALLLGFGALVGFWAIRGAAIAAAKETATEVAKREAAEIAKKVAEEEAVPEARRAVIEWLQSQGIDWSRIIPGNQPPATETSQDFADAMGEENNHATDDP